MKALNAAFRAIDSEPDHPAIAGLAGTRTGTGPGRVICRIDLCEIKRAPAARGRSAGGAGAPSSPPHLVQNRWTGQGSLSGIGAGWGGPLGANGCSPQLAPRVR